LPLHPHGSALLSVHPKVPAAADQPVIAACPSSVEQATGGMTFADGEMRKEITNRAYKHSFPLGWNARHRPRLTAAAGDVGVRNEFAAMGFGKFTRRARPHRRNPAHKFCVALIRRKRT